MPELDWYVNYPTHGDILTAAFCAPVSGRGSRGSGRGSGMDNGYGGGSSGHGTVQGIPTNMTSVIEF
jgi:hypothetical protein